MKDLCLLDDEIEINEQERKKRYQLAELCMENLPKDIYGNISVIQPAVGCLNRCSFCSQEAGVTLRMLDGASIRTLIGALKIALKKNGFLSISQNKKYKPNLIFPYLDNDIGSYPYLKDYLIGISSIGGKTRISTIGWSRKNTELNEMHREIVEKYKDFLCGIRLSLTMFSASWNLNYSDYIEDFSNSLNIYKPLLGAKSNNEVVGTRIDIDFKPDVYEGKVDCHVLETYIVITSEYYTLVLVNDDVKDDVYEAYQTYRRLKLTEIESLVRNFDENNSASLEKGKAKIIYNEDGGYYAFYSDSSKDSTDGVFYFPTSKVIRGGVLNAVWPFREIVEECGFDEKYEGNAKKLLLRCTEYIDDIERLSRRRANYFRRFVYPIINALCYAFEKADIPIGKIFDKTIVRDRGIIRNSGRAHCFFRGIASKPNVMVTPDSVLTSQNRDTVWRVYVECNLSNVHRNSYGGKNYDIACCGDENVRLIVRSVDAISHSNYDAFGNMREYFSFSIDEFVNEMEKYDLNRGKEYYLMPGI